MKIGNKLRSFLLDFLFNTASHRKPRGVWGFSWRVTGCPVLSKSVVALLSHIENLIKKRSKNAHVVLMDSQDVDVMTNHIITLLTLQNHTTSFCLVVAIQLVESFYKI